MLSNYLLIALENLKREPGFAAIKVLSLALGLGCSLLVIMHVLYATSFDKHFPNWQNTYRLVSSLTDSGQHIDSVGAAGGYGAQMKLDYPQIEFAARVQPYTGRFSRAGISISQQFHWADPEIIDIFSLQFVSGDAAAALNAPDSVVINETTARKYFPNENSLGQTLTLNEQVELRVTGVMRDLPANTHLQLQVLIPIAAARRLLGETYMRDDSMCCSGSLTYLTVTNPQDAARINGDLAAFVERHLPEDADDYARETQFAIALEPLANSYLSRRTEDGEGNNRKQVLLVLGIFAALILLTSCINFANLSVAQMRQRHREIGVRKTLGAKRRQITQQFLLESLLLTSLALLVAMPAIYLAIPAYTSLTGTTFTAAGMTQSGTIAVMILFVCATGIVTGLIPALILSRVELASIVKGAAIQGQALGALRSAVTMVQYGFSTVLIILAASINLQVIHLNTMDPGFEKNNLVVVDTTFNPRERDTFDYDALISELRQHPGIVAIGKSGSAPPNYNGFSGWRLPGSAVDSGPLATFDIVDIGYLEAMQLRLLAGRWFSAEFPTDYMFFNGLPQSKDEPVGSIVITRQAARNFGFASPQAALDQILIQDQFPYRVIGVVEDYYLSGGLEDAQRSINILQAIQIPLPYLLIRIDPAQTESVLAHIDSVWAQHRPEVPINRTFYNQTFNDLVVARTDGISKAAAFASIITVLVSITGLYALAFYSTRRRTKEIGIRKVAGASSARIVRLLSWDFLKPVLAACALACVAGYFAINAYFQQFSSRVQISILLYAAVTAGTLLIAMLTVATQCYRAATTDPVKSLRYE